jgi:hypothetical protein
VFGQCSQCLEVGDRWGRFRKYHDAVCKRWGAGFIEFGHREPIQPWGFKSTRRRSDDGATELAVHGPWQQAARFIRGYLWILCDARLLGEDWIIERSGSHLLLKRAFQASTGVGCVEIWYSGNAAGSIALSSTGAGSRTLGSPDGVPACLIKTWMPHSTRPGIRGVI